MAFRAEGFKTITETGTPDSTAGSYRALHAYVTNDDGPTVEAANYFDTLLAQSGRIQVGDVIIASIDADGTPIVRHYVVTSVTTHLAIAHGTSGVGMGLMVIPFFTNLIDITATDILALYTPGFAFKIEALDFIVNKPATTASKLATLQAKIGATLTTGGVVSLTSAAATPQGTKIAGTAITAANVGSATDTISINASAVTAFVEGNGWIMLKLRNLDG